MTPDEFEWAVVQLLFKARKHLPMSVTTSSEYAAVVMHVSDKIATPKFSMFVGRDEFVAAAAGAISENV